MGSGEWRSGWVDHLPLPSPLHKVGVFGDTVYDLCQEWMLRRKPGLGKWIHGGKEKPRPVRRVRSCSSMDKPFTSNRT